MKATELRERNNDELAETLEERRKRLFDLRRNAAAGEVQNNAEIRQVRRDVARILTILRERELAAAKKLPKAKGA